MRHIALTLLLAATAFAADTPTYRIPAELTGTPAHAYLTGILDAANRDIDATQLQLADSAAVLSGPDVSALARALTHDPQAMEGATTLTTDLRRLGRIGPDEEVIGRDGRQVITARSDRVRIWQK